MTDRQMSIFDTVLAVFDKTESGAHNPLGTAFAIGEGALATAGHVAEAARDAHAPGLWRRKEGGVIEYIPITDVDIADSVDFGVLYADYDCAAAPWVNGTIPERLDVWSEGFGFGFDVGRQKLIARHLKGHIVSRQKYDNWVEIDSTRTGLPDCSFVIYELSFAAPLGHSGAPLFTYTPDGGVAVIGVITGNSKPHTAEIEKVDVEDDGSTLHRYETYNYIHLGQAISTEYLLTIKPKKMDKLLLDHFRGRVVELT